MIVFEFFEGPLHGQTLTGGADRSLSKAHLDPVLRYWFESQRGRVGARFRAPALSGGSASNDYEVFHCIESDEQIIVQARACDVAG